MPAPVFAAAASSMRRAFSAGSNTSVTGLKNNVLLRLSHHVPSPSPLRTASYRFSSLSTAPDNVALAQDGSSSEQDSSTAESISVSQDDDAEEQLKYRKLHFTPEMDKEILELHAQGLSWMAIGSTLGIPFRSCHRRFISALDPSLYEDWPEEKIKVMDELVVQGKTWVEISQIVGSSATNCQIKWKSLVRPKGMERNRLFDALQSKVILSLVEQYGEGDWKKIMREFMLKLGDRDMAKVTPEQLRHQYIRLQRKPTHTWPIDDETALIQHVLKHGTDKWEMISEALKTHTPEQCKERWMSLDMKREEPKVRSWYRVERSSFWKLYLRYGGDWEKIASQLKKRTPGHCEDFFNKETAGLDKSNPEEFAKGVKALAEEGANYRTIHWKQEDSDRLWKVAEQVSAESKNGRVDWKRVAELMNTTMSLTSGQYKHHHYYLKVRKMGGLAGAWTEEETHTLERAVQEVGNNWHLISEKYLPHRNPKSLCHKYNMIKFKGSHISPEEYDVLLSNVERQEEAFHKQINSTDSPSTGRFKPDWKAIAKVMPKGVWTAEQCKSAYESSFKNHLKNVKWTPEEDKALLKGIRKFGRKNWPVIALQIPGKDNWECRLRWAELQDPVLGGKDASDKAKEPNSPEDSEIN
ncbi:Myblike DNAbinding domain-containing protein [Entomortierella chlamydospora]|nr:Myblike DNAbinding domain-containing protein [Entomortierella chlamydospora]